MKPKHKETLKWLGQNEQIRDSLADAIRNNSKDDILNIIDPVRQEPVMETRGCDTLSDLVKKYGEHGPAHDEFYRCLLRLNWGGRETELGKMKLSRKTYTARQLFHEITDHQRLVDGLPMG